jgi:hypothetical protein
MADQFYPGLIPTANISGSQMLPATGNTSRPMPTLGGSTNPFLPQTVTGQQVPPSTSPSGPMPADTQLGAGVPNFDIGQGTGLTSTNFGIDLTSLWRSFMRMGYPSGVASLLARFLGSGAGYNPQVAQALIAQMGPSIERGQEDVMEQFSAMGNRFGSPAGIGLADYNSQVQLNIGETLANLYEQSIQNYMNTLLGSSQNRKEQKGSGIFGVLGSLLGTLFGGG